MADEKYYEVTAEDGLTVPDATGKERQLRKGKVLPRGELLAHPDARITWLLDQHLVKEVAAPHSERPAEPSPAGAASPPEGRAALPTPPDPAPSDAEGGDE